jgi:CRP-like cAMP-binding protein
MSDFSIPSTLRQHSYFARAAEPQIVSLALQAIRRTFGAGEIIFLEGEPSAGLWILESGRVKAFKLSPDGREHILRFFGPSDTFNDLAALDNAANAASTAAVTTVTAWVVPTVAFMAALRADHDLALAVIQGLVGRVRHLVARVEDLALRPVTARLARFLLERAEDPTLSSPAVTRALIATHLGTTPETISRSLHVLEGEGAIRFDRHQIRIVKANLLKEIAMI